ncbi:MAG TPA: tetratricopeptide repeat protein [Gammaproteobacteria bacterium]|nr:tetratricopeptide repeat protein [Gammaproteobacteria bacterium]
MGLVCMKTGRMNEAISYYKKAIGIDLLYEDAILNLANAYTWLGELDSAFEWFEKVLVSNQRPASVHFNYAYALLCIDFSVDLARDSVGLHKGCSV